MTATVVGLTQSTRAARCRAGLWRRLRADAEAGPAPERLPAILGGLRIAAPNAVLGAILAEFGGGGRWGLGVYLLGSLGRADPARLWGIGLAATAIAGSPTHCLPSRRRVAGASRAVTSRPRLAASCRRQGRSPAARLSIAIVSAALPFLLWWAFLSALDVPD